MENLTINENGTVRIGGEVADYDGLLEILSPIGEYETEIVFSKSYLFHKRKDLRTFRVLII